MQFSDERWRSCLTRPLDSVWLTTSSVERFIDEAFLADYGPSLADVGAAPTSASVRVQSADHVECLQLVWLALTVE